MSAAERSHPARVAPQSFLGYGGYRYLKLGAGLVVLAIAAYAFDRPPGGPSGGTWLGYGLGSAATLLMLWLMWFGVRKRSYSSRGAPLRGWLSGHVYLGLTLLVIVPLHSGFQFGANVHTLAFALMAVVILTGIAGVFLYDRLPTRMTQNRPGQELRAIFEEIADLDAECRQQAAFLPDAFARAVRTSIEETRIGGGLLAQLLRRAPRCGTTRALEEVEHLSKSSGLAGEDAERVRGLIESLSLKQRLLTRVRRDVQYKGLLDVWLVLHVSLAFGALAAVAVHIFVVFYYR